MKIRNKEIDIITRMNEKVNFASEILETTYAAFDKGITLPQPFYYETRMVLACDVSPIPDAYAPFWYHPDHLGSSSYITNLAGEINQHMEYLPFGELLVEEHLNSYNSPFKFNAKEFDNDTGNYYYSARYYSPKYNLMLSMDQMYYLYPSFSPYAYTLQNPVRFVDPTGMAVESPDHEYRLGKDGNITLIKETDDNFDRLYNSDNIMVGQVNKGYLSDGINIEENGLFLDVQNKEDFHSYMNFTLDLSIEVNKEIGGFILDSESGFDNVYIASYKENEPRSAKGFVNFINSSSYDIPNKELSIGGKKHKANAWFHTHPDIMSPGYGSSRPSLEDRNATKDLQIPGVVLGGWGGIGLINTDGTYIRWGK